MASRGFKSEFELVVALEAFGWILGHGAGDRVTGETGNVRTNEVWRRERGVDMRGDNSFDGRCFERDDAGDGVVERAGEAVHVGEEIFAFTLHLLWRDVVGRAPDGGVVIVAAFGFAGETEIDQL